MIVIDTSVAIKWVIPEDGAGLEPGTSIALSLLERGLIAPDLIMIEFGNALWKKIGRGEIGIEQATESLAILPTIIALLPVGVFAQRALEIAIELNHAIYDCFFIAVAEAHAVPLVTADRRLVRKATESIFGPLVIDLATEAWI